MTKSGVMGLGGHFRGSCAALAILTLLAGCSHKDNGLTKGDYRDIAERTPPGNPSQGKTEPPIPELQPILAAPPPPALEQRLVSVSVPDADVPVRDVLIELARKVGVDLDLDQKISGGVIIYAKDRPFAEVIDRICELANLRYTFKSGVLHVELDTMYNHDYRVELPNLIRKSASDVSTSTDVFSAVQGGSAGGGNNSSSKVGTESTNDSWKDIEDNLKQILANANPHAQPITSNQTTPDASAAAASVPAAESAKPATPAAAGTPGGTGTPGTTPADRQQPQAGTATPQSGQTGTTAPAAGAVSNFSSTNTANQATDTSGAAGAAPAATANPLVAAQMKMLQAAGADDVASGAGAKAAPAPAAAAGAQTITPSAYFTINKSAGIVSVFGTAKQQKLASGYLKAVVTKANGQVLIEAKVVEVALNDQFRSGVDWQQFVNKNSAQLLVGTSTGQGAGFLSDQASFGKQVLNAATANPFTIAFAGESFDGVLNFVEGFGTTRTLSNPRITTLNNQVAVLKVAQNQVYFSLTASIQAATATSAATATYSSTLHTVPIGVVMTVQPQIDLENNQITMNLRPSVSVHSGDVADPAVALSLASACSGTTVGACSSTSISSAVTNSNVPVVDIREMDSVVTVPSGDVIVMGGMMQSKTTKQDTGVPGAADIPLLGNLFKVQSHETDVTELVIFLRATIVHSADTIDWADKDVYKRYMQDPRPLAF